MHEGRGREDGVEAEDQVEEEMPEGVEWQQVYLQRMQMGRVRDTMSCTMHIIRE